MPPCLVGAISVSRIYVSCPPVHAPAPSARHISRGTVPMCATPHIPPLPLSFRSCLPSKTCHLWGNTRNHCPLVDIQSPPPCPPFCTTPCPPHDPPSPPFLPPPLVSACRLWRPVMQRVCRQIFHLHAEFPIETLPWRQRQEGAAFFALVPAHAIRALALGVTAFTGAPGRG